MHRCCRGLLQFAPDMSIEDVPHSATAAMSLYRKHTKSWLEEVGAYYERDNYLEKEIPLRALYGYAAPPYTVRYASGVILIVSDVCNEPALVGLGDVRRVGDVSDYAEPPYRPKPRATSLFYDAPDRGGDNWKHPAELPNPPVVRKARISLNADLQISFSE